MGSRSGVIPDGGSIGRPLESYSQESNLKVELGGNCLLRLKLESPGARRWHL